MMTRAQATSNTVAMALTSLQGSDSGIKNICDHAASIHSNCSSNINYLNSKWNWQYQQQHLHSMLVLAATKCMMTAISE